MDNLLLIELSEIEYHLFSGGWKIHHIVSDEIFKSRRWEGYKIINKEGEGSYTVHCSADDIITQDIEVVPANPSDLHYWKIKIDGKEAVEQRRFSTKGQGILSELQKNEGLTAYEFHNKKFDLHSDNLKYFSGKIVHFTDFKYHL
jgi:hypothetical protein